MPGVLKWIWYEIFMNGVPCAPEYSIEKVSNFQKFAEIFANDFDQIYRRKDCRWQRHRWTIVADENGAFDKFIAGDYDTGEQL